LIDALNVESHSILLSLAYPLNNGRAKELADGNHIEINGKAAPNENEIAHCFHSFL
jgi:hypothetical protein